HADIGAVNVEDIPGFMDSSIFKALTPQHVDTKPVADMQTTAQAEVGEVRTQDVPGIYHSDFMKAPDGTAADVTKLDFVESSPNAGARITVARTAANKKRIAELPRIICRCGEK